VIALVVVSDGRGEYLEQMIPSLAYVKPYDVSVIVNDSGDPEYGEWLDTLGFDHQVHHERRRGLGAAVQSAWKAAKDLRADFVFHVEEDFVFHKPVPLEHMAEVLDRRPHLCQLVLKRQPWSPEEHAAGGQIECDPDAYTQVTSSLGTWTEHAKLFSFNPSLIPDRVFAQEWGPILEADVSERLFVDPKVRSAYWGAKAALPVCEHIGIRRSAGYRW